MMVRRNDRALQKGSFFGWWWLGCFIIFIMSIISIFLLLSSTPTEKFVVFHYEYHQKNPAWTKWTMMLMMMLQPSSAVVDVGTHSSSVIIPDDDDKSLSYSIDHQSLPSFLSSNDNMMMVESLHLSIISSDGYDEKRAQKEIIPSDFVGLSLEWSEELKFWSSSPIVHHLLTYLSNPQQTLFSNISSRSCYQEENVKSPRKGLNIRVGGNSADQTRWWSKNSHHNKRNESCQASYSNQICVQHNITATTIEALYQLVHHYNFSLTLDVTFMNVNWTVKEIQGIVNTLKRLQHTMSLNTIVEGFEIGNEPDLYARHGHRAPNYTIHQYIQEYQHILQHILPLLQQLQPPQKQKHRWIQGGNLCVPSGPFVDHQNDMIEQLQSYLQSWSWHYHPLHDKCRHQIPTITQLLDEAASFGAAQSLAQLVQPAFQHNLPIRISESNSVACGGQANVSDTLSAALWAMDYLFEMIATRQIERVNLHGGGHAPYSWFILRLITTKQN